MTATATLTDERIHLGTILHPIEAVLLDRVEYGWEDEFYQEVIDPMTPWYPDGDETGETPLARFTETVRRRARQAALEAVVSCVAESLTDASEDLVAKGHDQATEQLRADMALARQPEAEA